MATKLRTPYNAIITSRSKHGTSIPITQPIDSRQVKNAAGGFVFPVDGMQQLTRFLVLGTQGGTYYASEAKLTKENADNIKKLIEADGVVVVAKVVEMSFGNRLPKMDPALFVLAMCHAFGNTATKQAVKSALPKVARIPTHLFNYIEFVTAFRGWGRSLRESVADWYTEKNASQLAYLVSKYQSRNGWSNRDLLRLSHTKTDNPELNAVLRWAVKGWTEEDIRRFEQEMQ